MVSIVSRGRFCAFHGSTELGLAVSLPADDVNDVELRPRVWSTLPFSSDSAGPRLLAFFLVTLFSPLFPLLGQSSMGWDMLQAAVK